MLPPMLIIIQEGFNSYKIWKNKEKILHNILSTFKSIEDVFTLNKQKKSLNRSQSFQQLKNLNSQNNMRPYGKKFNIYMNQYGHLKLP